MKPEYYEGVTLTHINKNNEGGKCSLTEIIKKTGMGWTTAVKAIRRLEDKGRLRVARHPGRNSIYEVVDPPGEYDLMAYALHMESRLAREVNNA